MTQTPGRRERKKQETRWAIVGAAVELFSARGFDAVTVAEITEAADVDPSTFFRHFPAKEAVLFADIDALPHQIEDALLARPDGEPVVTAATHALLATYSELARDPEQERIRQLLMTSTPTVRAWMSNVLTRCADAMAGALAKRMNVDPDEDPRPYLIAVLVVQSGFWVRNNRLAHGASLDRKGLVVDIPEVLARLVPVLSREE